MPVEDDGRSAADALVNRLASEPDLFVNTNELRFIERAIGAMRAARILQQRWVLIGTAFGDALTDKNSQWRDVPLVDAPLAGQFRRRWKTPLPAESIEEITLSEAATKAWNAGGEVEARLERVDESLARRLRSALERVHELEKAHKALLEAIEAMKDVFPPPRSRSDYAEQAALFDLYEVADRMVVMVMKGDRA